MISSDAILPEFRENEKHRSGNFFGFTELLMSYAELQIGYGCYA